MGSSFGELFRISTFGESHGGGVGVIIDGCPPGCRSTSSAIQAELDRRRPGQSRITTPRKEDDRVEILSGLLDGVTLGTPIAMLVRNKDQRPGDYKEMAWPSGPPTPMPPTRPSTASRPAAAAAGPRRGKRSAGWPRAPWPSNCWPRAHGTEVMAWVKPDPHHRGGHRPGRR